MNSESVVTLEKINSRLDEIELVLEKGFKDIGTQLKEHARTLTFLSQTLHKSGLLGKFQDGIPASAAAVDSRTQYEKIREDIYLSMNIELNEENKKSPMGKEIDEFLTRMRLTFLKSRLNIADAPPQKLRYVMTSKFPNVMTNFDKIDVQEKDQIKQINGLFTGNVYQGTYTKDLIKNLYNIFLNWS